MQSGQSPPTKKSGGKKSRPTWRFEVNIADSIRLIHKEEHDDVGFAMAVVGAVGNSIANRVTSFFSNAYQPPIEDPEQAALAELHNEEVTSRIMALENERGKINTTINQCESNKQPVDELLVKRKSTIQDEIWKLIFRKDISSYKLNKKFAELESQIQSETKTLNTLIEVIKAEKASLKERMKAEKATPSKDKQIENASLKECLLADIAHKRKLVEKIDDMMIEKVEMVRENIREHARKRVDIFFITCIALYKRNVTVTQITSADAQFGKGSEITGTAACHAALVKNLIITPIPPTPSLTENVTSTLQSVAETVQTAASKTVDAVSYVASLFQKPNTTPPVAPIEPEADIKPDTPTPFVFSGSYLEEVLNITTELPTIVNSFDCLLEGKFAQVSTFVEIGMETLNKVAKGELHPFQAMSRFAEIARKFFAAMDYNYFETSKDKSLLLFKRSAALVAKYQSEGTFCAYKENTNILSDDYIKLTLGLQSMTKGEKLATFFSYQGYVDDVIMQTQHTLLTRKPMRTVRDEEIALYKAEMKAAKEKNKGFKK